MLLPTATVFAGGFPLGWQGPLRNFSHLLSGLGIKMHVDPESKLHHFRLEFL